MRAKLILSMLVILVAIVAAVGGTLAWFTDTADIPTNTFEAGTVLIEANDDFGYSEGLKDWNPGDCTDKEVTLELTGSKRAFVRMKITESWTMKYLVENGFVKKDENGLPIELEDPETDYYENLDPKAPHTTWDGFNPDEWQLIGDWLYYKGILYPNPEENSDQKKIIQIMTKVCFYEIGNDEEKIIPGNEYQGAVYTIKAEFEAIQITNDASADAWGYVFNGSEWVLPPVVVE